MIELRPFSLENINTHYQWNNDPELTFLDSEYPHQDEPFDSFLSRMKTIVEGKTPTNQLLEVFDSNSSKLIGVVDIHAIDSHNRRCFIQITIGNKEYCDSACQQEALEQALEYCFKNLNMHKVATTSFDFNKNWIKLVSSKGFKKEGELRDHVIKNDEFRDKFIYSLLDTEFKSNSVLA